MCVFSVTQLCPTLCNPKDYDMPGSSVHRSHGTFTCKNTEWVAISSSRGSSRPRDPNQCLLHFLHWKQILYWWVTREVPILYIYLCVCVCVYLLKLLYLKLCFYLYIVKYFQLFISLELCTNPVSKLDNYYFHFTRRRTLNKVKKLNHIQYKIS